MAHRMARQAGLLAVLLGIPFLMMAQVQASPPVSGQPAPAQAQMLAPAQLDDLVAPIALYPDPLLSQVLVATTYPLEVVEAQQWLQKNGNLRGQQLMDAARQQNWDASVQAMVAFPDVLTTLNQDVQWATALGNAFLAQQSDVMAAVQRMRARAQANGKLATTPQQTVTTETQNGQTAIDIAPADPQVIYVPEYDPAYVWGPPEWGYYPPLYYAGYGFGFYPGIDIGLCFGGWGGWGWGGWGWGWGPNWFGRSIFVNGFFFNHYGFHGGLYAGGLGRGAWQHDASHRLGVAYPNSRLAARYGATSMASRSAMTTSSRLSSTRSAGAGSWNRFGNATSSYGNRSAGTQGARSAATPGAGRTSEGQWQHFQGSQRYSPPAQRSSGSAQRYSGSAQRYSGSAQRYSGSAQRYSGSAQRYSAPAQRYSAPAGRSYSGGGVSRSYSGGGGSRSFGGGGGHSFGGGGGHSSGGGGGHGGGRR
jgi:hypothetical protein